MLWIVEVLKHSLFPNDAMAVYRLLRLLYLLLSPLSQTSYLINVDFTHSDSEQIAVSKRRCL